LSLLAQTQKSLWQIGIKALGYQKKNSLHRDSFSGVTDGRQGGEDPL